MILGRYKITVILASLLCVLVGAASFLVWPHQKKYQAMKEKLHERELVLAAREAECVVLNKVVYDLEYTAAAVEKVAREKYKLCRVNERLYRY